MALEDNNKTIHKSLRYVELFNWASGINDTQGNIWDRDTNRNLSDRSDRTKATVPGYFATSDEHLSTLWPTGFIQKVSRQLEMLVNFNNI